MNSSQQQNCRDWIEVFTRLESDGAPSLERLERMVSADVRFRDPFNDLVGPSALRGLLEHTRRQIPDVRFEVIEQAPQGQRVYLKWEMTGTIRVIGFWRVQGVSELVFNDAGKLVLHQDYWDASEQFYARLPLFGWILRRIRSLASA